MSSYPQAIPSQYCAGVWPMLADYGQHPPSTSLIPDVYRPLCHWIENRMLQQRRSIIGERQILLLWTKNVPGSIKS